MTTRRLFITTLFSGLILIPKAKDAFKWKLNPQGEIYIPNLAWVDAPYEVSFWMAADCFKAINLPPFVPAHSTFACNDKGKLVLHCYPK